MTVRAFVVLLLVTVLGIAVGDRVADGLGIARGLERSFAVLVVAAAFVAPAAWLLERIGWIRGRVELGRRRRTGADAPAAARNDGRGA